MSLGSQFDVHPANLLCSLLASSCHLEPCAKFFNCLDFKNHFAAPATPRRANPPTLPKTGMQLKTALDHSTHTLPPSHPLFPSFVVLLYRSALSPPSPLAQLDGSVVMECLGYLSLYHAFFSLKTDEAAKPNGKNFPCSLPQNFAKLTGLMDPFQLVSNHHHEAF